MWRAAWSCTQCLAGCYGTGSTFSPGLVLYNSEVNKLQGGTFRLHGGVLPRPAPFSGLPMASSPLNPRLAESSVNKWAWIWLINHLGSKSVLTNMPVDEDEGQRRPSLRVEVHGCRVDALTESTLRRQRGAHRDHTSPCAWDSFGLCFFPLSIIIDSAPFDSQKCPGWEATLYGHLTYRKGNDRSLYSSGCYFQPAGRRVTTVCHKTVWQSLQLLFFLNFTLLHL